MWWGVVRWGVVGCGEVGWGWGLVGSLRSPLAEQVLDPSAPVPYCSRLQPRVRILVDGSLRLQAAQPDDAGRYTCVPSNGLPRSPSASAYLTVLCKPHPAPWTDCFTSLGQAQLLPYNLPLLPPDPAQVTAMPPETPLPVGMRGVIRCPVRANPPLLFVSWTKDGQALQLDKVQAWGRGERA